jgi:ZIP family zinc transporter
MSAAQMIVFSIVIIFVGTALGSSTVFFFRKRPGDKLYSVAIGLAGGIMIAAAFFGLLNPSIDAAKADYPSNLVWLPPLGGFLLGALLLYGLDKIVPHLHEGAKESEGLPAPGLGKHMKFFLAVTLHNIPEGLVTGFSCGLALAQIQAGQGASSAALSAMMLAIGIAIQNAPETMAISVPLYADGMSKPKAFLYGTLSGVVEPVLAVAGMYFAAYLKTALSWFLAFGAGAMIYVTIDELLPEAHQKGLEHYGLWAIIFGFSLMMLMETLL